ncbi:ECF RNA polymerase sigma factor SigR [Flavobacteriales bacterium]|nr:ECF RNA polymerase sigma factor SigR [Flavobacteriales bacterium]MCL4815426.1 RNA polymerase sigma factor [Flavobacteriales bacterium]WKZ75045.1 MAG: RNA polymerase sigma factor [Vicingaceae bacterium]GIK69987.1 MAG: RNA polymerase sigma factor [Bacteroidota bacterium]CAG0959192.1 ECF RNA polymerase sigma factor SigR [Flavobacteriales bacterium]
MTAIEFNHQVVKLQTPLKYFAIKLTADAEDAHDLLQDTILKAFKYRDKFVDKTNLKAWLYTIMKNTFINNYRRSVRTRMIIDNSKDLYVINTPSKVVNETVVSKITHNDIWKSVNELNNELRTPFKMHVEGFKYKEIADEMNLPIGTVKSRIFLARKKLMEELKEIRN